MAPTWRFRWAALARNLYRLLEPGERRGARLLEYSEALREGRLGEHLHRRLHVFRQILDFARVDRWIESEFVERFDHGPVELRARMVRAGMCRRCATITTST